MNNVDEMRKYAKILNESTNQLAVDNRNDEFTKSYMETMLWSEMDDEGNALDSMYGPSDFSMDAMNSIRADCAKFQQQANLEEVEQLMFMPDSVEEMAGHDFWLTRAGHGAGFWDGDWDHHDGQRLTELSKTFQEQYIYVGDDGQLHVD